MPRLAVMLCLLAALVAATAAAAPEIERGDEAWALRAGEASGARAAREPIASSILAYQSALRAQQDSLEIRWKLLRSLHFAATFASGDPDPQATFERAARLGEEGLDRVAARLSLEERLDQSEELEVFERDEIGRASIERRLTEAGLAVTDVARLHFWTAIAWGAWSQQTGLLASVREGVANRIHRYARVAVALEPGYEDGGAYRLLGRLHATLPRVPFVSGWVDPSKAIPLLERGHAVAPWHPGNCLLLSLTLLDLAPGRRDEALALLRRAATSDPRRTMWIEDRTLIAEARERLARLEEETASRAPRPRV
jgi:tetratricopeptide (TPR) repeat protein